MGLFSNNKKLCPICGKPTPRLLARKIEDVAICSECDGKIYMRQDRLNNLTLKEFEEYLAFYAENEPLRKEYKADYEKPAGFLGGKSFNCDSVHHTFRLSIIDRNFVYQPEHFVRLVISQDDVPVFELTKDALVIHDTGVAAKLEAQRSAVDSYNMVHELTNSFIRYHNEEERRKEGRSQTFEEYIKEDDPTRDQIPDFRGVAPFRDWVIRLEIDHPWCEGIQDKNGQVFFDSKKPSVEHAIFNYEKNYKIHEELAMAFRNAICPNAVIKKEAE